MKEGNGEKTRRKDVCTKDHNQKQMETSCCSHECHRGSKQSVHTVQPPQPMPLGSNVTRCTEPQPEIPISMHNNLPWLLFSRPVFLPQDRWATAYPQKQYITVTFFHGCTSHSCEKNCCGTTVHKVVR